MRRLTAIAAVCVAALVGTAACSGGGSTGSQGSVDGQPKRGGNLTIARSEESRTLNKTMMHENEDIWVVEQIYQTLYVPTQNGDKLKPLLATGHKLSADKRTWTFHLRHGVKFSNGKTMTSADVKFSIKQNMAKDSLWAFINTAISSITTPDKWTVVVHTKHPWAPLLSDLSMFANAIIPKNFAGKSKKEFYQHPIGTGPFKLAEWKKGHELKLVRNTHYWQPGRPYLDSVTWTTVPDANTRVLQTQGNQADIGEFPSWSSISKLKGSAGVTAKLFPSSRTDYLIFNNKRKPFGDVHVRKAISYALDRKAMLKAALFGNGKVATSYLTPALWGHADVGAGKHDLAKAKSELAKSSEPNGFSTTLMVSAGDSTELTVAQLIQQQLKAIGIKVKVQRDTNSTTDKDTGNYDMTFTYDTTDITDPDELVEFGAVNSVSNSLYTGYKNPKVNRLASKAARVFDKGKRKQIYAEAQRSVAKDVPYVPLYYTPFAYAVSNHVHGFKVYTIGYYPLQDVWLDNA